jgi:hypothetical protein
MLKIREENLKRVLGLLLSLVIFGCDGENTLSSGNTNEYKVTVDVRLPVDTNGYYRLTIDRDKWQTLHRVSGTVSSNGYAVENFWVEWESDLYWYLGDTLGYIINRNFNDNGLYVSVDTSYMIGFNGMEVPTSNIISYSNSYGEINNMIAPVRSMIGDTLTLMAIWYNSEEVFEIVLD